MSLEPPLKQDRLFKYLEPARKGRLLLKDASVWLLDEITANLYPITAVNFLQAVLTAGEPRTLILMTHRTELVQHYRFDRKVRLTSGSTDALYTIGSYSEEDSAT